MTRFRPLPLGALTAILLVPPPPAAAQEAPLSAHETARARALLRDHLPCLGCHQLDGEGGTLGPALDSVGARLPPAAIAAMIADPQGARPGIIMPRVPMHVRTRSLLVRYLAARGGPVAGEVPAAAPNVPRPGDPAARYARYCAPCHGATGDGDGPNARFLPVAPTRHASADYMRERADDALYDAIAAGGRIMGRSPRMPPFASLLSPTEIRGLVAYLRTLCRCEGPEWSRDE